MARGMTTSLRECVVYRVSFGLFQFRVELFFVLFLSIDVDGVDDDDDVFSYFRRLLNARMTSLTELR